MRRFFPAAPEDVVRESGYLEINQDFPHLSARR